MVYSYNYEHNLPQCELYTTTRNRQNCHETIQTLSSYGCSDARIHRYFIAFVVEIPNAVDCMVWDGRVEAITARLDRFSSQIQLGDPEE